MDSEESTVLSQSGTGIWQDRDQGNRKTTSKGEKGKIVVEKTGIWRKGGQNAVMSACHSAKGMDQFKKKDLLRMKQLRKVKNKKAKGT